MKRLIPDSEPMTLATIDETIAKISPTGWVTVDCLLQCPKHGEYVAAVTFKDRSPVSIEPCPKCSPNQSWADQIEADRKAEAEELSVVDTERLTYAEQVARETALRASGIPADYVGKLIDDVRDIDPTVKAAKAEARAFVENFGVMREEGIGFCFYGAMGVGKTMLACAILQEVMNQVEGVRYATVFEAIRAVKEASQFRGDDKKMNALLSAPLLVLDELGASEGFSYEESYLMQIVDSRVSARRPTIYVTNLMPDAKANEAKRADRTDTLRSKMGDRVFNRICGSVIFKLFKGDSQRRRIKSVADVLQRRSNDIFSLTN